VDPPTTETGYEVAACGGRPPPPAQPASASRGNGEQSRYRARRAAPDDPAVVQALVEHVDLRRRAQDLAAGGAPLEALHELGRRLAAHIRHEENVLFPLVEATLAPAELAALGAAIDEAERH
jgi:hypothetical protein